MPAKVASFIAKIYGADFQLLMSPVAPFATEGSAQLKAAAANHISLN